VIQNYVVNGFNSLFTFRIDGPEQLYSELEIEMRYCWAYNRQQQWI